MAGAWAGNTIMTWAGNKVTDHGRSPLEMSTERIGADKRMADGTLRRFYVKSKRTWTVSWENIPSLANVTGAIKTADGGWAGTDIENYFNTTNGSFRLLLRRGSGVGLTPPTPAESALPYEDANFYIANVMITDFSKTVSKRGPKVDLWNLSITLEEV